MALKEHKLFYMQVVIQLIDLFMQYLLARL